MQPTILDTTPRGLADLIDGLAQELLDADREAASILIAARESLRNLGNNRWARAVNRASRARTMRRRQQSHCRDRVVAGSWVRCPRESWPEEGRHHA